MKKILTVATITAMGLSLAACGSKASIETSGTAAEAAESAAETLTGAAEGFGGEVSVELTRVDGKITEAKLTGDKETPEIGGKALEELSKQVVAANGSAIDGVSGATITSTAVKNAVAAALGEEVKPEESTEAPTAAPVEMVSAEDGIALGEVFEDTESSKGFVQAVAAVKDETIVAAYLDEFQFFDAGDGVVGVPNSDADFGAGYAEGKVLISKRENNRIYSDQMAQFAKSTHDIADGFDVIQNFVVGKTIAEIEELAAKDDAVDAVSGATLESTNHYLSVIADAAKNAQANPAAAFTGKTEDLKLKVVLGAAHGTKCFSTAAVLTDGENIINSYLDELQFMAADSEGIIPVSEVEEFKAGQAEGQALVSKRTNDELYSANMAAKANATRHIAEGYQLIENAVNGGSIQAAEELAGKDSPADAVSGSTLADTTNYIALIVEAAKA